MFTERLAQLYSQRDLLDVVVARQYTPYATGAPLPPTAPESLLQMYVLDPDPARHVAGFLKLWRPPYGALVLDCGCGTGTMAAYVQQQRPDLRWLLLGHHAEQLQQAARVAPCLQGDMHAVPLAAESVDAVLLAYVLGYGFAPTVFAEISRVLRPGGRCILYDMVAHNETADTVLVGLGYKCYALAQLKTYAEAIGWQCMYGVRLPTAQVHPQVQEEGGTMVETLRQETIPVFYLWEKTR